MKSWREEADYEKMVGLSCFPLKNHMPRTPTLKLPSVTLVCVDCVYVGRAAAAMEWCMELAEFGAVKLLTSLPTDYPHKVEIQPLNTLVTYSVFMLKKIHEYVDTEHMLIVQHDGIILNPASWDPAWLKYDYIAPIFNQTPVVGSGGFSLRTKRMMARISALSPAWDGNNTEQVQANLGCYEDGAISMLFRSILQSEGYQYAPVSEAIKFAQGGNRDRRYHVQRPFGLHRPERIIDYEGQAITDTFHDEPVNKST